jgi:tyrosinase
VADGPFQNLRLFYYGTGNVEHCLIRSWNNGSSSVGDMFGSHYTTQVVDGIQTLADYKSYRPELEGNPHGAVHTGIGGDMIPPTSPNGE